MAPVRPGPFSTQPFQIEKPAVSRLFEDKKSKPLATTKIKLNGKYVQLLLIGQVAFKGIRVSTLDEETTKHDLAIELEDEKDLDAFRAITERVKMILPEHEQPLWKASTSYLYDDKLSLKMKVKADHSGYDFKSNVKLSPTDATVNASSLYNGRDLRITTDLLAWFNRDTKRYGIYFPVKELKALGEEAATGKRKKKEEEEEDMEVPLLAPEPKKAKNGVMREV